MRSTKDYRGGALPHLERAVEALELVSSRLTAVGALRDELLSEGDADAAFLAAVARAQSASVAEHLAHLRQVLEPSPADLRAFWDELAADHRADDDLDDPAGELPRWWKSPYPEATIPEQLAALAAARATWAEARREAPPRGRVTRLFAARSTNLATTYREHLAELFETLHHHVARAYRELASAGKLDERALLHEGRVVEAFLTVEAGCEADHLKAVEARLLDAPDASLGTKLKDWMWLATEAAEDWQQAGEPALPLGQTPWWLGPCPFARQVLTGQDLPQPRTASEVD